MNIAVLISGGVDSSVALHLLCKQGHAVTAFYLKIWLEDELSHLGTCPWEEDLQYVRAVCAQLDVPLEVIPLQREYHAMVVDYMLDQIRQGYTPNPDMLCNQQIKFGAFYQVIGNSYDKVATGHYAQVSMQAGRYMLQCSPDIVKDQTYFLALLTQEQLARALFPIGNMPKLAVRQYADQHQLSTAHRKDSQGICFLGKLSFPQFLEYHLGVKPGDLIEYESGRVVGTHRGYWFYTVGQRQGMGLAGGPWYVVRKRSADNVVYISRNYDQVIALRSSFRMRSCHWIAGEAPQGLATVSVKLRHGSQMHTAQVQVDARGGYTMQLAVVDQGIASGQFAVMYADAVCLGGGAMEQIYSDMGE